MTKTEFNVENSQLEFRILGLIRHDLLFKKLIRMKETAF